MFRLLIVDDEAIIANGIKSSVEWRKLGIDRVETAYNMRQAKEAFDSESFDVMICDIEMPQGTGFDLFSWVRENHPKTECIFLTCHAEFAYAKRAVQLGSLDYLLKPVPREELEKTIDKALEKIRRVRNDAAKLLEHFWSEVLRQEIPARVDQILEQAKRHHLPYTEKTMLLPVLFHLDYWDKKLGPRDEHIMFYALRNALEELVLIHYEGSQAVYLGDGVIAVIVPSESKSDLLEEGFRLGIQERCAAYIQACNMYFYCHLSCYVGDVATIDRLAVMYNLLAETQRNKLNTTDRVLVLNEMPEKELEISSPNMKVWSEMLRRLEKERMLQAMLAHLEVWKNLDHLDVKRVQFFYQGVLQLVLHTLQETGLRAEDILHEHLAPERAMVATRSVRDLQHWVSEVIEIAVSSMEALESNETIVERIRRYIALHLDEELSRQYIADHVGLSPDYVVKLFKKEVGLSITDYILKERLSRAKELLLRSDMSISDVALSVGYPNFSYFSTLFRKESSMTPQEFRKQNT
ncbi:response regulator [Paenibacillus sp. YIM B09110]|uniref:response regulator n=1 Tax=Paenibacillus sp. YIM B09110 TaxID=3126102 RepID=UPI00301E4E78